MTTTELFLLAMLIIFSLAFLVWRLLGRPITLPLVVLLALASGSAMSPACWNWWAASPS